MNPYEPPQTVNIPVADVVLPESISAARLAAGLKELTQAGNSYCVGVLAAILVVVLSYFFRPHSADVSYVFVQSSAPTWIAMLAFFCLIVSIVFFGWGLLRQRRGCQAIARELAEDDLAQLFRACQTESWLKAALISCLLIVPVGEGQTYWYFSIPVIAIWVWYELRSIYHHTQAFEFFFRVLQQPEQAAIKILFQVNGYIAIMGTAILFVTGIAQFSQHQLKNYSGLIVIGLLWASAILFYTLQYRRLMNAFYKMI
jgi:uncharacterized integral membrane protein